VVLDCCDGEVVVAQRCSAMRYRGRRRVEEPEVAAVLDITGSATDS
jgi:hypothetical protein